MTTFNNKLSIFIPRVLPKWANEESISIIFKNFDIGEVERVDFVEKKTQYTNQYNNIYYHAFVHFKEWSDTTISRNIQEKIFDPDQVAKIVYDDPKYWIILKNNNPMTANEVKQEKRIIDLEEQNTNQNKIMLNYLNRVTNLETQLHQMQTTYWNSQMASMVNSFNIQAPPPAPRAPPAPPAPPAPRAPPAPPQLVRQTNSHEVNNKFLDERMQYESDETGNYTHRTDYEDRNSYQEDNAEDYYDYYQYDMNILE